MRWEQGQREGLSELVGASEVGDEHKTFECVHIGEAGEDSEAIPFP